jgi:multidrug resistance efflux pump
MRPLLVRQGAKVGSPLIGIVDIDLFHVTANFKEYVAAGMRAGNFLIISLRLTRHISSAHKKASKAQARAFWLIPSCFAI